MQELIGKIAILDVKGMQIEVKIIGITNSYGKTRYEITPVAGTGITKVEKIKIK